MRIFASENVTDRSKNDAADNSENGNVEREISSKFKLHILKVFNETKSKWILCLIAYNAVVFYELCAWATTTHSLALRAYANTVLFNIFALVVCLVSIWVRQNVLCIPEEVSPGKKPIYSHTRSFSGSGYPQYKKHFASHVPRHSISGPCLLQDIQVPEEDNLPRVASPSELGLEKYEVLALLISSCLALAAASLTAVETVRRIKDQPVIHTGRLGLGSLLGLTTHVITVYSHRDAGLDHVVCRALPCPTLRDYNPIFGGNVLGAAILSGTHLLIHYWDTYAADTAAAFGVVSLIATSMLPLAFYTASIILQKLPHYMGEQLDKCLCEALNIDGVLEFRNERFWTQSFGKLAGTVQVRIRRDANGSRVLEGVVAGLSRIVTTLRVQEFHETPKVVFRSQQCTEYYINELLPNDDDDNKCGKKAKMIRNEAEEVEIVSIDEILGYDKEPAGTFSAKPIKSEIKIPQPGANYKKTVTLHANNNIDMKNFLFNPQRNNCENTLLLGANLNENNFKNFTAIRTG